MLLILKNLLFTVVVPGTVAVYVPVYVFSHPEFEYSLLVLPGSILLIAGLAIYAWCVFDFASAGKGTPAPIDPPKHLVVRGLYKYSRNPMYLGVLSVMLGWAFIFRSVALVIYCVCVALCFHTFVVLYEERYLKRTFGASYDEYCAKVGRWFSPVRISRRHD